MGLKQKLKESVMLHSLKKSIKQHPFNVVEIEKYALPEDASGQDTNSYYFSAHDLDKNSLLLRRAERGDSTAEVWFVLMYDKHIYFNKKQVYKNDDAPIKVLCVEPGKNWQVLYSGEVFEGKVGKDKVVNPVGDPINMELVMNFTATSKIFDFTYHLNPRILAKALAKETWNKAFITNMRDNQQRHYEQQGTVFCELKIGDESLEFDMRAMRDHSFGRREWNYMDRHIWLMALVGENESLNVNMVSYPHMKDLRTGYHEENNQTNTVAKAPALRSFAPTGDVPDKIEYDIELDNGALFHVEAVKEIEVKFPFSKGAYTICEGIGTFEVNGKKGRGIIEFGYNGNPERWT